MVRFTTEPIPGKVLLVAVVFQDFAHLGNGYFIFVLFVVFYVVSAAASCLVHVGGGEVDGYGHVDEPAFLEVFYEVGFGFLTEFVKHQTASYNTFLPNQLMCLTRTSKQSLHCRSKRPVQQIRAIPDIVRIDGDADRSFDVAVTEAQEVYSDQFELGVDPLSAFTF